MSVKIKPSVANTESFCAPSLLAPLWDTILTSVVACVLRFMLASDFRAPLFSTCALLKIKAKSIAAGYELDSSATELLVKLEYAVRLISFAAVILPFSPISICGLPIRSLPLKPAPLGTSSLRMTLAVPHTEPTVALTAPSITMTAESCWIRT